MPVQPWTPVNAVITSTDEHGIHTFEVFHNFVPNDSIKRQSKPAPLDLENAVPEYEEEEEGEEGASEEAGDSAYDIPPTPASATEKSKANPPKRSKPSPLKLKHAVPEDAINSPLDSAREIPPTPTSATKKAGKILQNKYHEYPPDTPDSEMFEGDPDLLLLDNLFRLAKRYTMAQIADQVNKAHAEDLINQPLLSNRLKRAVDKIAQREGRERDEVLQELRKAQKENGVSINGKKRKRDVQAGKEMDTVIEEMVMDQNDGVHGGESKEELKSGKDDEPKKKRRVLPWSEGRESAKKEAGKDGEAKKDPRDDYVNEVLPSGGVLIHLD